MRWKKQMCLWFQKLSARERIECVCSLLHMCLPLELRFFASVVEDHGRIDYNTFRHAEDAVNKQTEVGKLKDLSSLEELRSRMLVYLALLHSSNRKCADILYDVIDSKIESVFSVKQGDCSNEIDEVLTILTLASNHPAFKFEQRRHLHEHIQKQNIQVQDGFKGNAEDEEDLLDFCTETSLNHCLNEQTPLPFHPATVYNRHPPITIAPSQPRKVFVQNIEVRGTRKSTRRKGGPEYHIVATWSNGEVTEVGKQFREIQEFNRQIMQMYPDEKPPNGRIPSFPTGNSHHHSSRDQHIQEQVQALNTYFSSLTNVPNHILGNTHVCQFFRGINAGPAQMLPIHLPPHLYHQPMPSIAGEVPGRIPGIHPAHNCFPVLPQRFQTSHTCHQFSGVAPSIPPSQLVQVSSVSPPCSAFSSTASSPSGSRSTSPETAALSQFLEKYARTPAGSSQEQPSSESTEELSKNGLPQDLQHAQHKFGQSNIEKRSQMNGVIDRIVQFGFSSHISSSSAACNTSVATSSRSVLSAIDNTQAAVSDVAGGRNTPDSPNPTAQAHRLGRPASADSSDVSEDSEREKGKSVENFSKVKSQVKDRSAQVKVSAGGGEGEEGSSSPRPPSAKARMTPPDEAKPTLPSLQPSIPPTAMPCYTYHPSALPTHAPPGLLGQYIDPKGDIAMPMVQNANNNTNNSYATEGFHSFSVGIPHRHPLLQTGVGGAGVLRPPFKTGQPQPAHTNMSVLQGKNLITMPPEPKSGNPMSFVTLRPADIQTAMGPGMVTTASSQLESGAPLRMPMYHQPFGRGQAPIPVAPHPPVHQTQTGVISQQLGTRSIQTSLPSSVPVMTVSASHPITVTSHSTASAASDSRVSPIHNSGANVVNGQRDSGNESLGGVSSVTVESLRSSPPQSENGVNGNGISQVTATPSPPISNHAGCQGCAQGAPYSHSPYPPVMYPFIVPQGPSGLVPPAGMSGYYAGSHPLPSSVLTNGYGPEMYPYAQPMYSALNPPARHFYPVMQNNMLYHGAHSHPGVGGATVGSGAPPSLHQAMGGVGPSEQPRNKHRYRHIGCYNCGSPSHKAAECPHSTMESNPGKSAYKVDFKREDSD